MPEERLAHARNLLHCACRPILGGKGSKFDEEVSYTTPSLFSLWVMVREKSQLGEYVPEQSHHARCNAPTIALRAQPSRLDDVVDADVVIGVTSKESLTIC